MFTSWWRGIIKDYITDNIKDYIKAEQGRIHGNPVAEGWAGAVLQQLLGIQKRDRRTNRLTDGPTDGPTDTARCRAACPRLKR